MCLITKTPHACGHSSVHVLMACHGPRFADSASHDAYCAHPKVQQLSIEMTVGYECATCAGAQEKYDRQPEWDLKDSQTDKRLIEVSGKLQVITRDGDEAEAANSGGQALLEGTDGWVMVEQDIRTTAVGKERRDSGQVAGSSREYDTKRDNEKENVHPAAHRYLSGPENKNGKGQSF